MSRRLRLRVSVVTVVAVAEMVVLGGGWGGVGGCINGQGGGGQYEEREN